jgi:hypothetical protein
MTPRGLLGVWPAFPLLVLVAALLAGPASNESADDRGPRARPTRNAELPAPKPSPPQIYAVRRRGGVPPAWAGRARRAPGVTAVSRTALPGASRQDHRLVRAMERAGFTWGGRWPTAPDPMHFELQGN